MCVRTARPSQSLRSFRELKFDVDFPRQWGLVSNLGTDTNMIRNLPRHLVVTFGRGRDVFRKIGPFGEKLPQHGYYEVLGDERVTMTEGVKEDNICSEAR